MSADVALAFSIVRVMCDSQQRLSWTTEVRLGTGTALEAAVQSASPAHRVLTDGVAEEEVAVDAEIVAALALVVVCLVGLAVDLFFDVALGRPQF